MKIFLVDDDEVIRMGMRKIIENAGHDWTICGEAGDGQMALSMLDDNLEADLMICDVNMPIMNGLDLVKVIRQERKYDPKVIFLSGYNDFDYVRTAFMNGAYDYILKPFKKAEFIALIEKLENQMQEERQMEKTSTENKDFMVAEVLKHLITDRNENPESNMSKLKDLGIELNHPYLMTARIMVDQYYKQFNGEGEYDKQLLAVQNKFVSYMNECKELAYANCIFKQEIVILAFGDSPEALTEAFSTLHNLLNDGIEENTVTIGISSVFDDKLKISEALCESGRAASCRFYLGQNKFITYKSIEGKCIDIQYDTEPNVKELVHTISMCDYMKSKEIIEHIFIDLSYCLPDKFRKYVKDIVNMLSLRIENFAAYIEVVNQDYEFYVDYLNTFRELKTYMNSLLHGAIDYITNERDKKSKLRIEMAKEYIENHYVESIALNDIAEYVELNASYFSSLFKTETGINFSEYLLNVRMEHAKELLRNPKIKVYEIGCLVGYEDAVSFGRAFKKKWGISPKEYRNSVY